MKQLILVRHAKSDWNDPGLSDIDRPLNERGKRDAPVMAHRLLDKKVKIDALISSPAKRAAKTAKIFADELGVKKKEIIFKEDLYLASPSAFYTIIAGMDDSFDTIALFSHNGGITDFANQLTDARIDNIPTCGVFAIKIEDNSWKNFREAKKEFWFFDYPKAGTNKQDKE
ncbi:MAG TPA: histidine phosphatase family protein [Chitinophagaceae bacterium]|nr:histidine phosphatase family protein [Chitinophagaceae bacterium]